MRVNCPRARTMNALKSGFAGVFLPSFLEAHLADFAKISPALKKRAAQIKLLLMDVDGTMTDGSVTLLSQTDGTALEIKTFDAHDGQSLPWRRRPVFARAALRDAKAQHCCAAPMK